MKQVSIVGLGYIGLPTSILVAQSGYKVFGFDTSREKVDKINSGDPTISEPGISQRLYSVLKDKCFQAMYELQPADCFVIAVPTPFNNGSKKADLSYVFDAAKSISKKLKHGNLVILESTVPVGTTVKLAQLLQQESGLRLGLDFYVAHCPERVLPGKIFKELFENDRVIGGTCQYASELAKNFYSRFTKGKLYLTDDKTAEMVKLIENSSRDIQIALANSIDLMCQKAGINSNEVIDIANKHPRVNILNPGCGVGGHCIAVDPWFLVEGFKAESKLLKQARDINDKKPYIVLKSILKKISSLKKVGVVKPRILVLGLTFKPNVDDLRESPALKIALELNKVSDLAVCEPNISSVQLGKVGFENIMTMSEGVAWADIIVILVAHSEFITIGKLDLKGKEIIDSCGLLYFVNKPKFELFVQGAKKLECKI